MLKYIIKRLALSILILLGVSLIIYALIRCMPVDFVTQKLSSITTTGAETSQELIDAMMKTYGLDTNIFEGYASWLGKLLRFDFGESFKYGIPVIARLPIDPKLSALCDAGTIETVETDAFDEAVNKITTVFE